MRKITIAALTSLTLLGGCSTVQVTDFLKLVQADAATACLFVPTIDTILAVAAALGIPATGIAGAAIDTVAKAICAQVPPPASARFKALAPQGGGPAQTVAVIGGIPINGWKVH
jgi:hypothetical protein